ncbi:hypothetical protein GW17_00021015 [Ensete ventricosum]|nr:hypothetical protein GW17_00021015 [Ensete ventricosum]
MCPVPVPTICRYTSTDRFAISICIARYRRYIRSIRLSVRGSLVTRRYRQKSIVGGQFRPSAVDFDRQRPIEGEIDYRRSIEGEKGKKRKRRKKKKRRRTYFPRDVAALARGCFFSRVGRRAALAHGCFFSRARRRNCIFENLNYGSRFLEMSNEDKLKSLTFNEDLQARPWWSPTSSVNLLSGGDEEYIVKKVIERKSILPRLVYLSIQSGSISLKETDRNGTLSDANAVSELKCLLERYARTIGLSFDDAISVILAISRGQNSFKAMCGSVRCLIDAIQHIEKWVADQTNRSEDQDLDNLLSHVHRGDGPGCVFQILEQNACTGNADIGDRILGALQSWSCATVCRKIVGAQRRMLSHLLGICQSKLKLLHSMQ